VGGVAGGAVGVGVVLVGVVVVGMLDVVLVTQTVEVTVHVPLPAVFVGGVVVVGTVPELPFLPFWHDESGQLLP